MLRLFRIALLLAAGVPILAGAQLLNRSEPLPGVTAAGQPDQAALEALADEGYVAVIDLRGVDEDRGFDEAAAVEALGMTYISLPVSGGDDVTYDNAIELDRLLREADGPVLVHCASSNRVGALLSLQQRLLGKDAAEALAIGLDAGLRSPALQSVVESQLAAPPVQ